MDGLKRQRARVVYSYEPQNEDELELQVGDVIDVLEEVEEGWWRGILDNQHGVFPSNFVVLEEVSLPKPEEREDRFKKNHETLKWSEKRLPEVPTEKPDPVGDIAGAEMRSKPLFKGVASANAYPENHSKLRISNSESDSEKRLSFSSKKSNSTSSLDSEAPKLPPKPVREQARVLYPYDAQNEDELTIKEGDIITVITKEVEDRGWWKGEINGRIGVFPDNFVKLIKEDVPPPAKPDRPEKPPLTKGSSKPELPDKPVFSAVTDYTNPERPVSKVPPFKSSEIPKKSSDEKPTFASKKPLLPPQMKKPQRSSLIENRPTEESVPVSPPATSSFAASVPNGLLEHPTDRKVPSETKPAQETNFDGIESSENKLIHPTANRVKPPPKRRPPSHLNLIKDHIKDPVESQPAWIKDPGPKNQSKHSSQNLQDKEAKRDLTPPEKVPQTPPKAAVPRPPTGPGREGEVSVIPDTVIPKPRPKTLSPTVPSKPLLETSKEVDLKQEILDLKKEMQTLKESSVSREEFNDVLKQVAVLKESLETTKSHYNKIIRDLASELDEVSKHQRNLKSELENLKQLTLTV